MNLMSAPSVFLREALRRRAERKSFERFLGALPEPLRPLAAYVDRLRRASPPVGEGAVMDAMRAADFDLAAHSDYFSRFTAEEIALVIRVETLRATVTAYEKTQITSLSSSFRGLDERGKVKPGKVSVETTAYQSTIGSKPSKGVLLKRIAEAFRSRRILELGTNTGLSACYLAASPFCEAIVTIEGSADLAEIAARNIRATTGKCEIRNQFFSEALDAMIADGAAPFDLVFIDGQHQKDAMREYVRQVWPLIAETGVLVFDDIYWSHGMNEGWKEIVDGGLFAYVAEIDGFGLGVRSPGDARNVFHDFSSHITPRRISRKRRNRPV